MSRTMMAQKQMALAVTAQGNTEHRFTNLYSLMHWDYWLRCAADAVLAPVDAFLETVPKGNPDPVAVLSNGFACGDGLVRTRDAIDLHSNDV